MTKSASPTRATTGVPQATSDCAFQISAPVAAARQRRVRLMCTISRSPTSTGEALWPQPLSGRSMNRIHCRLPSVSYAAATPSPLST
jgi:hypothetical protein